GQVPGTRPSRARAYRVWLTKVGVRRRTEHLVWPIRDRIWSPIGHTPRHGRLTYRRPPPDPCHQRILVRHHPIADSHAPRSPGRTPVAGPERLPRQDKTRQETRDQVSLPSIRRGMRHGLASRRGGGSRASGTDWYATGRRKRSIADAPTDVVVAAVV